MVVSHETDMGTLNFEIVGGRLKRGSLNFECDVPLSAEELKQVEDKGVMQRKMREAVRQVLIRSDNAIRNQEG